MGRLYKAGTVFILLIYILSVFTSVNAGALSFLPKPQASQEDFLNWYAAHKNTGGQYVLDGELTLTAGTESSPVRLDGTGKINLLCGTYAVNVKSNVIIDNKSLIISGKGAPVAPVVLSESGANLSLQSGTITAQDSACLFVSSGTLTCPQGMKRFTLRAAGTDAAGAAFMPLDQIALSGLDIIVNGTGTVKGAAGERLTLKNCRVDVTGDTSTGVKTTESLTLINSSVKAYGKTTKSITCEAGSECVSIDGGSVLVPLAAVGGANGAQYKMTVVWDGEIKNVPAGICAEKLELPNTYECGLDSRSDNSLILSQPVTVIWNKQEIESCLKKEGEYTVYGAFSTEELSRNSIFVPDSIQPHFTLRVLPQNAIDKIQVVKTGKNECPYAQLRFINPYKAQELYIQYSYNGSDWENAFTYTASDGRETKEYNFLDSEYSPPTAYLRRNVYFPEIKSAMMIRMVVKGGLFEGTGKAVMLETTGELIPDIDADGGHSGDRGGAQNSPDREPTKNTDSGKAQTVFHSDSQKETTPDTALSNRQETQYQTGVAGPDSSSADESAGNQPPDNSATSQAQPHTMNYAENAEAAARPSENPFPSALIIITGILLLCAMTAVFIGYRMKKNKS